MEKNSFDIYHYFTVENKCIIIGNNYIVLGDIFESERSKIVSIVWQILTYTLPTLIARVSIGKERDGVALEK